MSYLPYESDYCALSGRKNCVHASWTFSAPRQLAFRIVKALRFAEEVKNKSGRGELKDGPVAKTPRWWRRLGQDMAAEQSAEPPILKGQIDADKQAA